MSNRTLGFAAALSLLLCLGVGLAWVRSYRTQDALVKTTRAGTHLEIATLPGQVRFSIVHGWENAEPWHRISGDPHWYPIIGYRPIYHTVHPLGIAFHGGSESLFFTGEHTLLGASMKIRYGTLAIPFSIPLALTLLLPTAMVIRTRRLLLQRQHRRSRGLCATCGYDLRASSGRCPECGSAV